MVTGVGLFYVGCSAPLHRHTPMVERRIGGRPAKTNAQIKKDDDASSQYSSDANDELCGDLSGPWSPETARKIVKTAIKAPVSPQG